MNDTNGFKIGEKEFKISKIDALRQFHIVRRLGPILGDIIPVMKSLKGKLGKKLSEEEMFDDIAKLIGPFMNGISKLSDEDANLVLLGLCSAIEVHQTEHNCWARISDGKQFMIQNLELPELLQAAGRAFAYNLTGFFNTARLTS